MGAVAQMGEHILRKDGVGGSSPLCSIFLFTGGLMAKAYISLGSNVGNRLKNIKKAILHIKNLDDTTILRTSSVYETEPVGYSNQNYFMNMVIEIETNIPPLELMQLFLSIEDEMGRERGKKWGPRNIDIDMLIYNGVIIESKMLTLPHPEMGKRSFIITPLKELLNDELDVLLKDYDVSVNLGDESVELLYDSIEDTDAD